MWSYSFATPRPRAVGIVISGGFVLTTAVSAAFENTMEEAFSALHCPNCEEFRRLRDFSQGRPVVKLSEVGNRQGGNQERATNAKPPLACMTGTLGVKVVFITVPRFSCKT